MLYKKSGPVSSRRFKLHEQVTQTSPHLLCLLLCCPALSVHTYILTGSSWWSTNIEEKPQSGFMHDSVKHHWHQPEVDSCSGTAPLSVALKDSSEDHPAGGQDFKPCLDLPLCLDHETSGRMGWHQLTDSNQQNGSKREQNWEISDRSEEEGCTRDLSEDRVWCHLNTSAESSQSSGKEGYSPVFIQWVLVCHERGRRSTTWLTRGYSCTDFSLQG